MENNVKMSQEDKGDFLEVKILLPKNDGAVAQLTKSGWV